jgi:hypothetical protein
VNPYQPPGSDVTAASPDPEIESVRRIATYQRIVRLAALVDFLMLALLFLTNPRSPLFAIPGLLAVVVAPVVAGVMLARALYGSTVAVLCAIPLLVPCVSFLMLLALNDLATGHIRKAGFEVGLLGARFDDLQ